MSPETGAKALESVPNLSEIRESRDKALALAYVEKGQTHKAVREISLQLCVDVQTVYRALKRQLNWALAEHANKNAPAADIGSGLVTQDQKSSDAPSSDATRSRH